MADGNIQIGLCDRAFSLACTLSAADLFVSPEGNDRNPGTKDSPKATLTAALRQARELRRLNDESVKGGITIHLEGGVIPNPLLSKVREGIELCQKEHVDFILAVGGGSVIDSSKAIGYGVANPNNDVWDFCLKKAVPTGCLPIGVILTIAASGSEMSSSSVITNEETKEKRGCAKTDYCRPKFAILNPRLTYTLPQYQTESGCVDILMHTMERYFVNIETMEITDSISEALMQTVIYNARILMKEPDNYSARAEIMWAGSLSHNGLTGCGTGGGDCLLQTSANWHSSCGYIFWISGTVSIW